MRNTIESKQTLITPIEPEKKNDIPSVLLHSLTHTTITFCVIAKDVGYSDFSSVLFAGANRQR